MSFRERCDKIYLPYALAIGVLEDEFWGMTMRRLNIRIEAYRIHQKMEDEKMWLMGRYNMSAFQTVMSHFGAGLSDKRSHEEYLEKPLMQIAEEKNKEKSQEEIDAEIRRAIFGEKQRAARMIASGMKETVIGK